MIRMLLAPSLKAYQLHVHVLTEQHITISYTTCMQHTDQMVIVTFSYRVFSHDVTAAILVSQNNEMAAMLVSQTSPHESCGK